MNGPCHLLTTTDLQGQAHRLGSGGASVIAAWGALGRILSGAADSLTPQPDTQQAERAVPELFAWIALDPVKCARCADRLPLRDDTFIGARAVLKPEVTERRRRLAKGGAEGEVKVEFECAEEVFTAISVFIAGGHAGRLICIKGLKAAVVLCTLCSIRADRTAGPFSDR